MHDSKIIRLIKGLDAAEFRLLYKYLRSPFFSYSPSILALYEALRKYYPTFSAHHLEREKIFAKVFPGEAFQDKKLRNLLHEFIGHIENFLVQLRIREDEYLAKKLLMEAFATKDQYGEFVQKNRELIAAVEARPYRDIATYQELLSLHERYYFHPATNKLQDGEVALKATLENLDHFFMANKLRLANEAAAREKVVQQQLPIRFVDEVMSNLKQQEGGELVLNFSALLYRLNVQNDESLFFELKEKLLDSSAQLSFNDRQGGLLQLLNFAIRSGNQGQTRFLTEAFELYWYGIQEKLLFENGKLTDSTFTNIVFGGCKIGALTRVESFIKDYAQFLEDEIRQDAEKLAMAYLSYSKKEFEHVDKLIGNFQFGSVFYQLRARGLLIRSLFELYQEDDTFFDLLLARMDAFEKYLRRNKTISTTQRDQNLGFIKVLRKIAQLWFDQKFTAAKKEKLKASIHHNKIIINKSWLLDQIENSYGIKS